MGLYPLWIKKQTKNINPSSDPVLYNYQLAELTVSYNALMRTDFGDVRFGNYTEDTELSYHLKSKTDGVEAVFVVKIPSTTTTAIKMYFGNAAVTTTSDPEAVFLFFDDATGTFNDKWNTRRGTGSYATVGGRTAIKLQPAGTPSYGVLTAKNYDTNGALKVEFDTYMNGQINFIYIDKQNDNATEEDGYRVYTRQDAAHYEGITRDSTTLDYDDSVDLNQNTWYSVEITRDQDGRFIQKVGGVEKLNVVDTVYNSGHFGLEQTGDGYGGFYSLRVSKYTKNPPTWGDWGVVEDNFEYADLKTIASIPYYTDLKTVACITPAIADLKTIAHITGTSYADLKTIATITSPILTQGIADIKTIADIPISGAADLLTVACIGGIYRRRLKLRGKVLYKPAQPVEEQYNPFDPANPDTSRRVPSGGGIIVYIGDDVYV